MAQETSTYGLRPEDLARLLETGLSDGHLPPAQRQIHGKAQLLEAMLTGTLPFDTATADALPAIVGRLCKDLLPLEGKSVGEALLDPGSKVEVLKRIKEYGKRIGQRERTEAEHAAGTAVYYGAIASALVHHDERITSHSYEYLRDAFRNLSGQPWVPGPLSRLLADARKACDRQSK